MPHFLHTDIEGSTQLWEKYDDVMGGVLDRHDRILLASIDGHNGRQVKHSGDGVFVVFDRDDSRPLE